MDILNIWDGAPHKASVCDGMDLAGSFEKSRKVFLLSENS